MRIPKLYLFLGLLGGPLAAQTTWSENISCILYSHCTSCHHSGGIAPFSLVDYTDAVMAAPAIQAAVNSGYMPPWPPDQEYKDLAHARVLTAEEISRINDWVLQGTPMGDPALAPTAPVYTNSSVITQPDHQIRMPDFMLGPMTQDVYRCFPIQNTTGTTQYIKRLEVLPGNPEIVHHVLIFHDNSTTTWSLDSADAGPGYSSFGGVGSNTAKLLGGWVPGNDVYEAPDGMGISVPAGGTFIIQVHYPIGSTGQADSTRVLFEYSGSPQRPMLISPLLNHVTSMQNGPLYIPANTVQTFHQSYTVTGNRTFVGVLPHAHLLCTQMTAYAVTPASDTIPLVHIPHWDFHWQGTYAFKNPVIIPAGSVLHGWATYDNTSSNPRNPSNPPVNVSVGEATTDEMMLFYFFFTLYQSGDENIVIDSLDHTAHHEDCGADLLGTKDPDMAAEVLLLRPNPVQTEVRLDGAKTFDVWNLTDLQGRLLLHGSWNNDEERLIDCSPLPAGLYTLRLSGSGRTAVLKLLKIPGD